MIQIILRSARTKRTDWPEPGNLTVASCSSLYFLKAGSREDVNDGFSERVSMSENPF